MRNSPYIGWFRHAPPTNVKVHKVDARDLAVSEKIRALAMILSNIPMRDHRPKLSHIISGKLRGGGRDSPILRNVFSEEESAAGSLLSKLGTWILYPLAQDAESLYKACYYDRKLKVLTEDTREVEEDSDSESEDKQDVCEESDEDSLALSDVDGPIFQVVGTMPPSSSVAKPMELSVSEIAEAYYAHQELDDSPFAFMEGDRLDYVITQADIARMAKNAARHLDVESILSLPTTTYRCPNKTVRNVRDSRDPDEAFSFIMVSEKFGRSMDQPGIEGAIDSECVICLEAFSEGDRLRVLPCNHSFHIGCIDRWLSGSHSHFECFTSGCPTCKKSPSTNHVASTSASTGRQSPYTNDGFVPSWAFAQLGSQMAQSMGE
jgi:Ring finger domain